MAQHFSIPRRRQHDSELSETVRKDLAWVPKLHEIGSGREFKQTSGVGVTTLSVAVEPIHGEGSSEINILRWYLQSDDVQLHSDCHHDSGRQQATPTPSDFIRTDYHIQN